MRKGEIITLLIFISTFTIITSVYTKESLIDTVVKKLSATNNLQKLQLYKWKFSTDIDKRCLDPNFIPDKKWLPAGLLVIIPPLEGGAWFWTKFKMPESVNGIPIQGSKVFLSATVIEVGEVFINGQLKQNFTGNNCDVLIVNSATPGEEYIFVIHIYTLRPEKMGAFAGAVLSFSLFDTLELEINKYLNNIETIRQFLDLAPEKDRWTTLLEKSVSLIDLPALDTKDNERFLRSLNYAQRELEPMKDGTQNYLLYLIGYSHIDLAWLWNKAKGENIWFNTSRTVLNLMNEYPEWIYCAGQAAGYEWMEKNHPEIFAEIKKRVEEGRWEIVGGTWTEFDSNLPGGESYVRQLLYGKRWFREKFNKDIVIAWLPDSFGFNWGLPQIFKKAGIIGFLTHKLNQNDTTKFPHNIFWWEGPDGSRLLTFLTVGSYGESLDTPTILSQFKTMKRSAGVNENFILFGVGDHGGGVTRTHLNRAFSFKNSSIFPKTEFITSEKYFRHLLDTSKTTNFPTVKDELYLEFHRGTYTTQADTKRNNRQGETALFNAETFSSVAKMYGLKYPKEEIRNGWNILMFNQFHDILPGSSINKVYKDADDDYAKMFEITSSATTNAIISIARKINIRGKGEALLVFNSLPWKRDGVVEISINNPENVSILNTSSKIIPSQIITSVSGEKKLLFVASNVPAVGYKTYRVINRSSTINEEVLNVSSITLENEFFHITLNPNTGNISSVFDKRTNYEYFGEGREGNILQCYRDKHPEYDAWNIRLHEAIPVTLTSPPEVVETGPVRVTLKWTKTVGTSTFVHYLSLVKGVPLIFGRLEVDWKETHRMAKLAFQLNLKNDTVWYEIPYAAISRPAVPRTDADRAKWEVSAQKWVDYTDRDGKIGLGLLNNSKYGFDVKDNVMSISLLRSPKDPDPEADMKHHTIEYALFPHTGDWRQAQMPRRGYEFNTPLFTILEEKHNGNLPASHSFFSSEPSNVILSSIKLAEDSDDIILRVYESTGKSTMAKIWLPDLPTSVEETNLLEEQPKKIPFKDNIIKIPIGPYEIKTLKVNLPHPSYLTPQ